MALLLAVMSSCVPGLRSSKPVAQDPKSSGAAQSTGAQDPLIQPLPPPPPDFKESESRRQPGSDPLELRQKEEINQAALKFAKEIPNVKHIKTCFSKIYGGWYLLLYLEAGKKISLQQYSWNDKSKEWDVVYHVKEVPAKQLEHHLKGEVGDERCFVLKK
jgi:hypothetical protein